MLRARLLTSAIALPLVILVVVLGDGPLVAAVTAVVIVACAEYFHSVGMAAGHTYKTIDLVGTSSEGVTEAIESAVNRAQQTLTGLDWFEVGSIRGQIVDGRIAWVRTPPGLPQMHHFP